MNLHRPAYLAQITNTLTNLGSHRSASLASNSPVSLLRPYTWRKAEDLVSGDTFLTRSGQYIAEVYAVYDDGDGVWIEDTNSEGYVDHDREFRVER